MCELVITLPLSSVTHSLLQPPGSLRAPVCQYVRPTDRTIGESDFGLNPCLLPCLHQSLAAGRQSPVVLATPKRQAEAAG